MKTYIPILLISISFIYSTYGQTPQLNDYTWYVHSVETSSGEVRHPIDPELFIETEFDLLNNQLTGTMCCGGSFEAGITTDSNSFSFSGFTRNDDTCTYTETNNFSTAFKDFFQDSSNTAFEYTLSQDNNIAKLEITNSFGHTTILYDSPHNSHYEEQEPYWTYMYISKWYVYDLKVGGIHYSGEDLEAEEFGEITAFFNNDGTFETEVCATLSGKFSFFDDGFGNSFIIACNSLDTNDTDCLQPDNTTLQEAYFDFFRNNRDDIMDFVMVFIDGQTGPCISEDFRITASSGDYIEFSSCSSLNTKKHEQSNIKLYPNPATETFQISGLRQEIQKISIYNVQGKLIKSFTQPQESYSIAGLAKGIYLLQLQTQHGNKRTEKLVIE